MITWAKKADARSNMYRRGELRKKQVREGVRMRQNEKVRNALGEKDKDKDTSKDSEVRNKRQHRHLRTKG